MAKMTLITVNQFQIDKKLVESSLIRIHFFFFFWFRIGFCLKEKGLVYRFMTHKGISMA